jgi:hypothetical protein
LFLTEFTIFDCFIFPLCFASTRPNPAGTGTYSAGRHSSSAPGVELVRCKSRGRHRTRTRKAPAAEAGFWETRALRYKFPTDLVDDRSDGLEPRFEGVCRRRPGVLLHHFQLHLFQLHPFAHSLPFALNSRFASLVPGEPVYKGELHPDDHYFRPVNLVGSFEGF